MSATPDTLQAPARETPRDRRGPPARAVAIVCASVAGVLGVGVAQAYLVLGITPGPRQLALPALVGVMFGALLAVVLSARERERAARARLVERDRAISALNAALEDRVRERTRELEEKSDALLRAQRLEVVGRMAGGVAHDFNNVLAAVLACSAAVRSECAGGCGRATCAELLEELDAALERGRGLSQQLLALARTGSGALEPVDVGALARAVAPLLRRLAGNGVRVAVEAPPAPAVVRADRSQLEQLLLNLGVNGRDAMPDGGTLGVTVERVGDEVVLVVADTGRGMDEQTRVRMFEPFFTTKGPGRGTGLGLAVVDEVVRRAGGRIEVDSRPGAGTRITVRLPACDAPAVARGAAVTG